MRVIAGKARRLILRSVPGFDTRPTSDKIKETLFNIIGPDIPGSRFLDLFSGTGGIGIEALSRGSSFCVFVENDARAVRCIRENLQHTRLEDDALVLPKNVLSAISDLAVRKYAFDIIYMDPPYKAGYEESVLKALAGSGIMNEDTLVIIEAQKNNDLDFIEDTSFRIERIKDYKTNRHFFLKLKDLPDGE